MMSYPRQATTIVLILLVALAAIGCELAVPVASSTPTTFTPSLTATPSRTAVPVPSPTPRNTPTAPPSPAPTSITTVYVTHTVTATTVSTVPLPLSPLPFGTLLVTIGDAGIITEPSPWAVDAYALSSQGQRLWIADGIAKFGAFLAPDRQKVAYIADERDGQSIWMANPDGTAARRLTPLYPRGGHAEGHLFPCGWSADSRQFAYVYGFKYGPEDNQLYAIDVVSNTVRFVYKIGVFDAEWDPQRADQLLIITYPAGRLCLFNIQTGDCVELGGEIPRLIRNEWGFRGFALDGEGFYLIREGVLAITGRAGLIRNQIHVNTKIGAVRWSPDGQRLLFAIYDNEGLADIYVMDSQGTDWRHVVPRQVFRSGDSVRTNAKLGSWSPDGQWFMIFNSSINGTGGELYICHADTGELHKVLVNELSIYDAVWLP